jgi:hypothetical protein
MAEPTEKNNQDLQEIFARQALNRAMAPTSVNRFILASGHSPDDTVMVFGGAGFAPFATGLQPMVHVLPAIAMKRQAIADLICVLEHNLQFTPEEKADAAKRTLNLPTQVG